MLKNMKLFVGSLVIALTIPTELLANTVIGTYKAPTETPSPEAASSQATPISSESSEGTRDVQFEKKLTDALTNNPDIIVAALQKFNQNQQVASREKLEASLTKYKNEISKDSGAVVLGKKNADVKLIVFVDPNCPHCRPFSQALISAREKFPNLSILIRHWAILGSDSEEVIRGLLAIKLQGENNFKEATKAIATSDGPYTFAKLLEWVKSHKLDATKFKKDAESKQIKLLVNETKKLASDIGLEGTPTSLLVDKNGIRLVVPTDEKSLESILSNASKGDPVKA